MNISSKRGRPPGSKNILPLTEKAEAVFNEVYKTFAEDLKQSSPEQRANFTVLLTGYLLTTKQTN